MDYHQLFLDLQSSLPDLHISENQPLAPHTTLKIGGPADLFIHTTTQDQFISILKFLHQKLPGKVSDGNVFFRAQSSEVLAEGREHEKKSLPSITILGNGSNVLISDKGLRGIVIKNTSQSISILDTTPTPINFNHTYTQRNENEPDKYLDFTKLDYDESGKPQVLVKISSGTPLPLAINQLINQDITGLQWFAYIPGTVGGATWYNIHGGAYHFADYLESVEYFDLTSGEIREFKKGAVTSFSEDGEREVRRKNSVASSEFKYETTPFQQHPEWIILSTTFRLFRGDAALAKSVKDAWITQKVKVQPMNSAGSVFANPSLDDSRRIWGEQKSSGWIIDHELGWKGKTLGGAQISDKHANFIVNADNATAQDYYELAKSVQDEVLKRFNLKLEMEVKLLGEF